MCYFYHILQNFNWILFQSFGSKSGKKEITIKQHADYMKLFFHAHSMDLFRAGKCVCFVDQVLKLHKKDKILSIIRNKFPGIEKMSFTMILSFVILP